MSTQVISRLANHGPMLDEGVLFDKMLSLMQNTFPDDIISDYDSYNTKCSTGDCSVDTSICSFYFRIKTQNICITFILCWTSVEDVGPTLYECYANVLCLLDMPFSSTSCMNSSILGNQQLPFHISRQNKTMSQKYEAGSLGQI